MLNADVLSFLENALDRDFYVPKNFLELNKPPLRILVTDAGDKIAYNLIYKLCSGKVFGPDQEVILHLNNSRGTVYPKDIANELFECGFPCYKGIEYIYVDVDQWTECLRIKIPLTLPPPYFTVEIWQRVPLSHQQDVLHVAYHHFQIIEIWTRLKSNFFQLIGPDFVVCSDPSVIYKDLDFVILIATFEEVPGLAVTASLTYQMIKARQVARYTANFAKPDCKIVLTGPSTKALATCLSVFRQFAPRIPESNITSVTCLDEFISKAELAAKLKTTTNRIRNVVIWNCTYPDLYYATVRMIPPDDLGGTEPTDIPVTKVVQDGEWLYHNFRMTVFRRTINRDLMKYGKSIALATAHHLRVLYKGTDSFDEIQSMGLISPPEQFFGFPSGRGFSYPVKVKNGKPEILRHIEVDAPTFLNKLTVLYSMADSYAYNSIVKVMVFLMDYENCKRQMISFKNAAWKVEEFYESKDWFNKFFITPNPAEEVTIAPKKFSSSKKSILWVEAAPKSSKQNETKSFNKINFEDWKQ